VRYNNRRELNPKQQKQATSPRNVSREKDPTSCLSNGNVVQRFVVCDSSEPRAPFKIQTGNKACSKNSLSMTGLIMNMPRSHELLNRRSSRLLIVDVQEKFVATLSEAVRDPFLEACRSVADGARLMEVPITVTEQYPARLGSTVLSLAEFSHSRLEKKWFSAVDCTGWTPAAEATDDRFQVVVVGMETHVCILQTVLDLLSLGYQTYVVVDAVAGRRTVDHQVALERMANSGATLTTTESVLFEWCETADAAEFKALSALIKSRPVT
jgi:nicotinamidase-related amidase